MKAVVFDGEALKVVDRSVPRRGADEALIRVRLAGICNTDIEITRGYFGFRGVLGHEFVGEVVEAEDPDWVGRRVVGEINLACGECEYCRRGLERHCPNRTVLGILGKDGCFAEYVTLPLRNLHTVPEGVEDEEAAFTEPLAAALEILQQVHVDPDSPVLVVGDGKLAQLVVRVLVLTGAQVHIVGRHPAKLRLAERVGATVVASEAVGSASYDLVVEASGSPSGWQTAIQAVRPRGTLVLKSTYAEVPRINLATVVVNEVNVVGSRCGPFRPALRLLADKRVTVRELISATYPLERAAEAFEQAKAPGVLKVLLKPPESGAQRQS